MATVTLNRSVMKARPVESLPAFWSSVIKRAPAPSHAAPPSVEKPSAVVGDLWIQIR